MHRLADALERACAAQRLAVQREREAEAFVRLSVSDGDDACEVAIAIAYRAMEPVHTRYGPLPQRAAQAVTGRSAPCCSRSQGIARRSSSTPLG